MPVRQRFNRLVIDEGKPIIGIQIGAEEIYPIYVMRLRPNKELNLDLIEIGNIKITRNEAEGLIEKGGGVCRTEFI